VKKFNGNFGETEIKDRDFITKVAIAKWSGSNYSILSINE